MNNDSNGLDAYCVYQYTYFIILNHLNSLIFGFYDQRMLVVCDVDE